MIVVPFWFLSPHVVVVWLANVEMVLPNLSWKQNGYGNIAVTVASRTAVLVVVVVVVCVLWGDGGHHSSDGGGVMVLLVVCLDRGG